MENKLISIVIPNWNGEEYIKACLESLIHQTYKNTEIIVVDNNSIDDSIKIICDNFPEIRLIELDKNTGFSVAVNTGIKAAEGEYIALINNDTVADKYWLDNMYKTMTQNTNLYSVASKVLFLDSPDIINSIGTGLARDFRPFDIYIGEHKDKYFNSKILGPTGCAALYRKGLFEKIGYFDQTFFAYFEDLDLNLRTFLYCLDSAYCEDAFIYHKMSGSSKMLSNFVHRQCFQNYLFFIIKDIPSGIICHYLFYFLSSIIRYKTGFLKRRRFCDLFIIMKNICRHLNEMLSKRKYIQSNRKVRLYKLKRLIDSLDRYKPDKGKIKKLCKKINIKKI